MTERQLQILDAAASLLRHYGYAKTTVADIARAAGVGVGTLYLDFPSKEDIVAALSRRSHDEVLAEMERAARTDGDFETRFLEMMRARTRGLHRFAEEGVHGLDLVRCACPAAEKEHEGYRRDELRLVEGFLQEASESSSFDCPSFRESAGLVLMIFDCLAPWNRRETRGRYADLDEHVEAVAALLLRGLTARS